MIPQSESDLIEWININPKREYTNMMEEITRDWFPEATYFHESEVWVDWEENVDGGTVSLVHAYPVLVVWPLRLTSQVCYEELKVSTYISLIKSTTTTYGAEHLFQLAKNIVAAKFHRWQVCSSLELMCSISPFRCLNLVKQYILCEHSPIVKGVILPSFINILKTLGWEAVAGYVLQVVGSLQCHIVAPFWLTSELPEAPRIEVARYILYRLCADPSLLASPFLLRMGHQRFVRRTFKVFITHPGFNILYLTLVRNIHTCQSSSRLVPLFIKLVYVIYTEDFKEIRRSPSVIQTLSESLTSHESIRGNLFLKVFEMLVAFDKRGSFSSFLLASVRGDETKSQYKVVNDLFLSICNKYCDRSHEPVVQEALKVCAATVKDPSWKWDMTRNEEDLLLSVARIGFVELPRSVFDSLEQTQLLGVLLKVQGTPHNKTQLMSIKKRISIVDLIPPSPYRGTDQRHKGVLQHKEKTNLQNAALFFLRLCCDDDQVNIKRVCSELITSFVSHGTYSESSSMIRSFCDQKVFLNQIGKNIHVESVLRALIRKMNTPKPFHNKYPDAVLPGFPAMEQFLRSGKRKGVFGLRLGNIIKCRKFMVQLGGKPTSKNTGEIAMKNENHIVSYSLSGGGRNCEVTLVKENGVEIHVLHLWKPLVKLAKKWELLLIPPPPPSPTHPVGLPPRRGENKIPEHANIRPSSSSPVKQEKKSESVPDVPIEIELLPPRVAPRNVEDVIDLT